MYFEVTKCLIVIIKGIFFESPVILLFKILIARRFGDESFHDAVTFYPTRSSP